QSGSCRETPLVSASLTWSAEANLSMGSGRGRRAGAGPARLREPSMRLLEDLIRRLAAERRHVIEAGREGADPGRDGAQLHDQVADFRLRDRRADDVPPFPARPGRVAEDLP